MAGIVDLFYRWGVAQIHNANRITKRPVNPANSQILGMCNPQAAATRPTIKARTTGTRGLFTPVLAPVVSTWEECSSTDGFSDMNFFLLSFREIISKVIIYLKPVRQIHLSSKVLCRNTRVT
jgi:hypothetical protein